MGMRGGSWRGRWRGCRPGSEPVGPQASDAGRALALRQTLLSELLSSGELQAVRVRDRPLGDSSKHFQCLVRAKAVTSESVSNIHTIRRRDSNGEEWPQVP